MIPTSDNLFDGASRPDQNLTGLWNALARARHCKKIAINPGCREVEGRESGDNEERDEIEKLYRIIDQYNLYGKIRWLGCA